MDKINEDLLTFCVRFTLLNCEDCQAERRNELEDEIGKCWYFAVFPVACLFMTTSGSSLSPSTPFRLTLLN